MRLPSLDAVDTLLLDMDGTLLDLRFDNHFWVDHLPLRYAEVHGLAFQEANEHVSQSLGEIEGLMDWYRIDHWENHFQLDIMALKNEVDHLVQYRPGSLEFLQHITEIDRLHVLLITDADPLVLALKQELTGILHHVDGWFSSHQFGAPKRDPRFWQQLSQEIEFNPERAMMVDDNVHVLEQSRQFGVRYQVLIEQPDSAREREVEHNYIGLDNLFHLIDAAKAGGST